MDIFRKKDASKDRTGMRRHLKIPDLILLGIGAMVGTGIFTITGTGAAKYAGPALTVSIVISALCFTLSLLHGFRPMAEPTVISMRFWGNFLLGWLAG